MRLGELIEKAATTRDSKLAAVAADKLRFSFGFTYQQVLERFVAEDPTLTPAEFEDMMMEADDREFR